MTYTYDEAKADAFAVLLPKMGAQFRYTCNGRTVVVLGYMLDGNNKKMLCVGELSSKNTLPSAVRLADWWAMCADGRVKELLWLFPSKSRSLRRFSPGEV